MGTLQIELDISFDTKALLVTDKKTLQEIFLDARKASSLLKKIPTSELSFELVSTNKDIQASFIFKPNNGKKGFSFEVAQKNGFPGLSAKIIGIFTVTLRAGVDKMLKREGKNLDLRLRGIAWKGGAYNGFMAYVDGSDHEQSSKNWKNTFPKIAKFQVK